jgi:hypothetical protein
LARIGVMQQLLVNERVTCGDGPGIGNRACGSSNPGFNGSQCIRGAPQQGFAKLISMNQIDDFQ